MKRLRLFSALLLAVTAVAACGSDDDAGESTGTTTADAGTASTLGTGTGGSSSTFKLDEPAKLVSLYTTPADTPSSNGTHFQDGAQLAIDEINARGGLGGHPVKYERFPQSPDNKPEEALAALNKALDSDPDVVIGPIVTSSIQQQTADIVGSGLPFVLMATTPSAFAKSGSAPIKNGFMVKPSWSLIAGAQADFALKKYAAKKVGLLCVDIGIGAESCPAFKASVEKGGGTVCVERRTSPTATDFTEQAIAMKCADLILVAHYPQPFTVFTKQLIENGVKAPVVHQFSFLYGAKLIPAPYDANSMTHADCVPSLQTERPESKAYADAFKKKYGIDAEATGANGYDSVMLAAEAIKLAKSTDPDAVIKAFESLKFKGACMDYATNAEHIMGTTGLMLSWDTAASRFKIEGELKLSA